MTMMQHFLEKTGMVAVEGGEVAYRYYAPVAEDKNKRTPLIFVQGGPGGCGLIGYALLHSLADDRPVLFYDQLGSYYSPAELTPEQMRLERFASEIGCLLDELKIPKAFLLGQSFGSAVATQFTILHQERVAGLILSGPHLSTPRWIADCQMLLADMPEAIQEVFRRCEAEGTTDSDEYRQAELQFTLKHTYRRNLDSDLMKYYIRNNMSNRLLYLKMWGPSEFSCNGTLKDMDLFPYLHTIRVPARLICGEFDTARPETVREAANRMQNADVIVVPDGGHGPATDSLDQYLTAVKSFFLRQDVAFRL